MSKINKVILIDNFDSFTYNLVDLLRSASIEVNIFRNSTSIEFIDEIISHSAGNLAFVLSPGPGTPSSAGNLIEIVKKYMGKIPMIGICLGHQAIVEACGGIVEKSSEVVHGKSSLIETSNHRLFKNLKRIEPISRYHSLRVNSIPSSIEVLASVNEIPMVVLNESARAIGFQFHPESILSLNGVTFLTNALEYLSQESK